jgi:hypothetical protein
VRSIAKWEIPVLGDVLEFRAYNGASGNQQAIPEFVAEFMNHM